MIVPQARRPKRGREELGELTISSPQLFRSSLFPLHVVTSNPTQPTPQLYQELHMSSPSLSVVKVCDIAINEVFLTLIKPHLDWTLVCSNKNLACSNKKPDTSGTSVLAACTSLPVTSGSPIWCTPVHPLKPMFQPWLPMAAAVVGSCGRTAVVWWGRKVTAMQVGGACLPTYQADTTCLHISPARDTYMNFSRQCLDHQKNCQYPDISHWSVVYICVTCTRTAFNEIFKTTHIRQERPLRAAPVPG